MYQIDLVLTQQKLDEIMPDLEERAVSVWTQKIEKGSDCGKWSCQAMFDTQHPDLSAVQSVLGQMPVLKKIPQKNWLKECYRAFPPVIIGKFAIYSQLNDKIPKDKIAVQIEAATAFGTGRHGTTNGCLKAWDELNSKSKKALDVGCGSGILSIAYAKQTGRKVDAVDLDPESVRVTQVNAKQNRVQNLVRVWQSDGYKNIVDTYDLIFCNILADPVIQMAPDLNKHLAKNGYAIVSGFLLEQADDVIHAHTQVGLNLVKQYAWDEWGTVVFFKP